MKYLRTILLCLTTVLVCAVDLAAQGSPDSRPSEPPFEEGLIRVSISGLGAWDVVAGFVSDSLYLPFDILSMPLGLKYSISTNQDTIYTEFPTGNPIRFIRSSNRWVRRDSTELLAEGAIREYDGAYYIRYDYLSAVLGIRPAFSLKLLKLSFAYDMRFPAVERAANKGRYAGLGGSTERERRSDAVPQPKGVLFGAATVQWSAAGSFANNNYLGGIATARLTGPFLYGTAGIYANAQQTVGATQSMRYSLAQANWSIAVLDFSPLSMINLSVQPRSKGLPDFAIALSNTRLVQSKYVATRDLTGISMPGWDIELYEGERLVEVTRADSLGRYSFTLPVGYGRVHRTVNEIGPHGERIVSERTIGLQGGTLLPGEIGYQANLTRENDQGVGRYGGNLSVRAGLFDWLNIGAVARMETMSLDMKALDSVEVNPAVDVWMGQGIHLLLEGSPQQKKAIGTLDLRLGQMSSMNLSVQSSWITKNYSIQGGFGLPMGPVALSAIGEYDATATNSSYTLAPRIGAGLGQVSLTATALFSYEHSKVASSSGQVVNSGVGIVMDGRARYRMARWLSLTAGGSYNYHRSALEGWNVGTTSNLGGVNLGISYEGVGTDFGKGTLQAQLSLALDVITSTTTTRYAEENLAGTSRLEGAFSISAAGAEIERTGSGLNPTIIIIGFNDLNLNGRRDGGEETFEAIRARQTTGDGVISRTEDGRFMNVRSYVEAFIDIDPLSLADANLTPMRTEYTVFGLPSMKHLIEVPFAAGYDVSGSCEIEMPNGQRRNSAGVLNGLNVRLVSTSGTAAYVAEVFFDGSILISGVAPGQYRLEFDREQLADRQIMLKEEPATVEIGDSESQLPPVVLVPAAKVN